MKLLNKMEDYQLEFLVYKATYSRCNPMVIKTKREKIKIKACPVVHHKFKKLFPPVQCPHLNYLTLSLEIFGRVFALIVFHCSYQIKKKKSFKSSPLGLLLQKHSTKHSE